MELGQLIQERKLAVSKMSFYRDRYEQELANIDKIDNEMVKICGGDVNWKKEKNI